MNDNSDIDGARQVVVRSIEKYNADRAGLLASDGRTPIYPPDVHTAKAVSYTHLTLPTSDLV